MLHLEFNAQYFLVYTTIVKLWNNLFSKLAWGVVKSDLARLARLSYASLATLTITYRYYMSFLVSSTCMNKPQIILPKLHLIILQSGA